MWVRRRKIRATRIDTLVGRQTELLGDIRFSGGLHVDGLVRGNVHADEDPGAVLTLSEHGRIEGEVNVPNVVLNGTVMGDVRARSHIELAESARVTGNVFYHLIEMAMGAEVNGKLVRTDEQLEPTLKLEHEPRGVPSGVGASLSEGGPGTDLHRAGEGDGEPDLAGSPVDSGPEIIAERPGDPEQEIVAEPVEERRRRAGGSRGGEEA